MNEFKTTKCFDCGKTIKYKTKKPKKCAACRSTAKKKRKSTGTKRKRPANKNTQGELILFKVLEDLMKDHDYINHGYYSFLPSPKGYPMQLDRYYPDLKLAFEFQGKQHSEYSSYIHGSRKNFEYYQASDALKRKHCKKLGITLIEVEWNHKITEESIKLDIKKKNPKLYKKIF